MALPATIDTETQLAEMPDPSDAAAWNAWRDAGGGGDDSFANADTPVAIDHSPSAEEGFVPPVEDAGDSDELIAAGEGEEIDEKVPGAQDTPPPDPTPADKQQTRLEKRFSRLTNEIRELKEQLAAGEEIEDETPPAPVAVTPPAEELKPPALADFEDFDQWRVAYDAYHAELRKRDVDGLRAEIQQTEAKRQFEAQAKVEQAGWDEQASRFPDFNDRLKRGEEAGAVYTPAMRVVFRQNPELGTRILLYFADNPDVSKRISDQTIARNAEEWPVAIARAGIEMAALVPHLVAAPSKKAPGKTNPPPATAGKPEKIVRTASPPPSRIRGTAPAGNVNPVYDEETAKDYRKWEKAREAEIKRKQSG